MICSKQQLSNEKRAPGWLGYIRDFFVPSYKGIISEAIIRIPISQPVQCKVGGFFVRGSVEHTFKTSNVSHIFSQVYYVCFFKF